MYVYGSYSWLFLYVYKQPSPPGPISIPGGGVPLNMREVEELERMTKDFIKDMDTHAPVITSPPTGMHTQKSGVCTTYADTRIPAVMLNTSTSVLLSCLVYIF